MKRLFLLFSLLCGALCASDITVVTMAIGEEYQRAVADGIANKRAYCQQHGYGYVYGDHSLDPERPIPWSKLLLILQVMEDPKVKWVFWSDADAVIMNMAVAVEDLIDEKYNVIISHDLGSAYNTGQFLIKNCEWSRQFLKTIYAQTDCIHHEWWDQGGFIKVVESHPQIKQLIKVIPQRMINSYSYEVGNYPTRTYQPGDFLIHFMGIRHRDVLKSTMAKYTDKVINDLSLRTVDYFRGIYGLPPSGSVSHGTSDIAVVTLAVGDQYNQAVQPGIEVKKRYCEQHGYEFICGEQVLDPSRPIAWSKIPLVLKAMDNPAVKWVFWTDADSVITNLGIKLEDFVDDQHNLIISRDIHSLNSGQFLVRNCDWSRQFLKRVYDHRECLHHIWWEQQAVISELYQHPEHWAYVKEVPQRLFNSYGVEYFPGPKSGWQSGDFIVHFPGVRDLGELKTRLEQYAARAVNDSKQITLDSYLNMHGLAPEEALTQVQSLQWQRKLSSHPQIQRVAEIGLHTGHRADQFLRSCPNLQTLVAFDTQQTRPTRIASEYLHRIHKDHFDFIPGDSAQSIGNYLATHHTDFDLIHIDSPDPFSHIKNARPLSHTNTIVWIENYHEPAVQQAVAQAVHQGILVADITHVSCEREGQQRKWLEAHYAPVKVTMQGLIGALADPKSSTTVVR